MLVFSRVLLSFSSIFTSFVIFGQYYHEFQQTFKSSKIIGMVRSPPSYFISIITTCSPPTKVDLSQAGLIFQNNIPPTSKSFGSPRQGSTIATLVGALVTISARTSRSEKSFVFFSSIVHISGL